MRMSVCKEFSFDGAHRLPNHKGLCANLHGHRWKLEVEISGYINAEGMVMDFGELKHMVKTAIIDKHDHAYLNELYVNPTAENMVATFVEILCYEFPRNITLDRVRLYETPTSFAEWRRVC